MQAPSHRTPHRRFTVVLLVLFALASVGTGPRLVIAQPATPAAGTCLVATEPNDQPADAIPDYLGNERQRLDGAGARVVA